MQQYDIAQQATTTSINSAGSAMREQEQFGKSLQARLNELNTAWYGFSSAIGQNIAYDGIVVVTKALTELTKASSNTVVQFGLLPTVLATIIAPLTLLNQGFRLFVINLVQSTATAIGARTANTALAVSMSHVAASTTTAMVALRGFLALTGVGAILAGIGIAITGMTNAISKNIQAQEEFDARMKKNSEALTVNKEATEELLNKYYSLNEAKNNNQAFSTEQEQEYLSVQQRLAEIFPSIVKEVDANGVAHLKTREEIEKEIEATKELIDAKDRLNVSNSQEEFKKLTKDTSGAWYESWNNYIYGNLESQIEQAKRILKTMEDNGADTAAIDKQNFKIAQLEDQYYQSSEKIKDSIQSIIDSTLRLSNVKIDGNLQKVFDDFLSGIDISKLDPEQLSSFSSELANLQIRLQNAIKNNDSQGITKAVKALNDLEQSTEGSTKNLQNLSITYDSVTGAIYVNNEALKGSAEASQEASRALVSADESMQDTEESAGALSKRLEDVIKALESIDSPNEILTGVSEESVEKSKELLFIYEQLSNRLATYSNEELQALLNKKSLTEEEKNLVAIMQQREDTIGLLSAIYPQFAKLQEGAIALSAKQIQSMKDEEKANEVLLKAYELSSEGKYTAEQNMTLANAQGVKARIENLKKEISSLMEIQMIYDEFQRKYEQTGTLTDDEGRGAMRAGSLAVEANGKIANRTAELEKLQSQLNSSISTIDGYNTSIENSDKNTKSSNKSTKESIYITDKYKQALEALNLEIAKQESLRNKELEHSDAYRASLQKEIKLQKEKIALMKSQAQALANQIKSGKISQVGNVSTEKSSTTSSKLSGWNGTTTSGYQARRTINGKSDIHRGIDIDGTTGQRLDANVGGKVIASGNAKSQGYHWSYGNIVVVQDNSGYKHIYAHLDKAIAKLGSTIQAGQQIGTIGSTGNSTGSHLHYEINLNGKTVDPSAWIKDAKNGVVSVVNAGNGAISTAQESIDEAKSTLIGLQEGILQEQNKLAELEKGIIESYLANYEYRRGIVEENYAFEESKLENLQKGTTRYNKTLNLQSNLLKRKQSINKEELAFVNNLIKSGKLDAQTKLEMTNRQLQLKRAIEETNSAIQQFSFDRVVDEYQKLYDKYDSTISFEESKLKNLDTNSARYAGTLRNIVDELEKKHTAQQKEMLSWQSLVNSGQYSGVVLENMKKKVQELSSSLQDLSSQISNGNYQIIANINTQSNERVDNIQFEIDKLQAIRNLYEEGSLNYNNSIKDEIKAQQQLVAEYDNKIKRLEQERKQLPLNSAEIKQVTEDLEDAVIASLQAQGSVKSLTDQLSKSEKETRKDIAESFINAYKDYINEVQDMKMKALDDEVKVEEERHKKVMKQYEDEMNLFRKNVQEKLDLIDKEEAQRTYDMEITDLQNERSTIADQINRLSLDNSTEAKAKRKELQKQLDELDKNIAEKQRDRNIELQKEALNLSLEQKEEQISNLQEVEDSRYETTTDSIEQQRKYWQQYYTDQLNDERKFEQMRKDIVNGNWSSIVTDFEGYIKEMNDTMPSLENTLNGTMQSVGTEIRKNVIDNLKEAMSLLQQYQDSQSSASDINNNPIVDTFDPNASVPAPSIDDKTSYGQVKLMTDADYKVLLAKYMKEKLVKATSNKNTIDSIQYKADVLAAEGRKSGSKILASKGLDYYLNTMSEAERVSLSSYAKNNASKFLVNKDLVGNITKWAASLDSGGMTNFKGSGIDGKGGKLIIAHDKEIMLNPIETSDLIKTSSIMQNIMKMITPVINKTPILSQNLAGIGDINVTFEVEKMYGTEQEAKSFGDMIGNIAKTKFGVNFK